MRKIERMQITGMTISGFKSYAEPTELVFGSPTVITGGNGRGKTSIADAIAFAVTGLPFFGERGLDRLHNESSGDLYISLRFVDGTGAPHELVRTRRGSHMTISYDGYELRQMDLTDLFGEKDAFLSIFNPLYFIEELREDGKKLLETYLPMISQEKVMAELSEPVRQRLEREEILSPDSFLKRKREEIRSLEGEIIYLTGQRDQAAAQNSDLANKARELPRRREALRKEMAALEDKQFSGMDISAMQERQVELSRRYDESRQDSREEARELRERVSGLREKLAARRSEQYQPKYALALAEAEAKRDSLAARYKREAASFRSLKAGMSCPVCHRPVTEETLPKIQEDLRSTAASLLAGGQEQQRQIEELQALEQKAREAFAQFQADDLKAWTDEAAGLEAQCNKLDSEADTLCDGLRQEIQALTLELEYGSLSQQEYDRLTACREEYRQCEAELSALQSMAEQDISGFDQQILAKKEEITELKKLIADVVIYSGKRDELTFSALKLNRVEISLYDVVKSTGERKDAFKFNYNGRRYDRLSLSEKIRAGMEVSQLVMRLTGRNYPVFVDNMESVDDLENVRPAGQIIFSKCVSKTPLQVRPVRPIPTAERKAAA